MRLSRRRFWKGDYSEDKIAAYQTLYTCLETLRLISLLASPYIPEISGKIWEQLGLEEKLDEDEATFRRGMC